MTVNKEVNPRFEDFLFDWYYKTYLLIGGYGSSKSYHIALKIVLKCLAETRKVLVVREVYDTIRESCFDLFLEILDDMDLLSENKVSRTRVTYRTSPMSLTFPNGSKIIFKGMDKPRKLKSINGVSIVWLEEASEVKYSGYKELIGRLRTPDQSIHFILSENPVGTENWTYQHFFKFVDSEGVEHVKLDDEELYKKHTIVKNGVYYHHSLPEDNLFLPKSYINTLNEMREYDPDLYRVARLGRFGVNGTRVLPQFEVAASHEEVMRAVRAIPRQFLFNGMDFGFETSYNAVLRLAVDDKNKWLYIYWEYYKNKMTDDKTAKELKELGMDKHLIIGDNEDPKAIQYLSQEGFKIRGCKKWAGSRLANTKKVKRFRRIICSPECPNTIRELKTLTYAKDSKDMPIYDEFNIDPHTFSAIWYGLDTYTVADVKERKSNSRKGG
jgi:phage terminase large subunit